MRLGQIGMFIDNREVKARGGVWGKKTSLAYIKVQPAIELLLFTESQNLRL